jgi:serine/threonine protein kinase
VTAVEKGELAEGTRLLDRYTIIDRVGAGGMASIYRAMDERLDRVVCVKLLRLELEGSGSTSGRSAYEATYSHFLQEALALSRLTHPNTLRIYDFGYLDDKGQPFQISEFLDGGNLEQYIRARGALTLLETSAILERITGAVAEAHEHKIIHRDIKPSNIIFGRMGEFLVPKLADFGIAHSNLHKKSRPGQRGWAEETGDGEEVSTITLFSPRWAAPEQLAGSTQGAATDVYALGLVAVYMLAGRPLFEGNDVRSTFTERVRGDDYIAGLLQEYGIAPEVRRVLLRGMAASPEQRYPTPGTFFDALQRVIAPQTMPPPYNAVPAPAVDAYQPRGSVTLSVEHKLPLETQNVAPPEQAMQHGTSRVRVVDVHEKLDLSTYGAEGGSGAEIRFRVSFLPAKDQAFRLHIKGLNCFVKGQNGRPTPAIVVEDDAVVSFLSTAREELGHVVLSFGEPQKPGGHPASQHPTGRVFRLDSGEMVVPSTQAAQAVALYIGRDRDVIILCRR